MEKWPEQLSRDRMLRPPSPGFRRGNAYAGAKMRNAPGRLASMPNALAAGEFRSAPSGPGEGQFVLRQTTSLRFQFPT